MEVEGMERPPSSQSEMPHIEGMSAENKMFNRLHLHVCCKPPPPQSKRPLRFNLNVTTPSTGLQHFLNERFCACVVVYSKLMLLNITTVSVMQQLCGQEHKCAFCVCLHLFKNQYMHTAFQNSLLREFAIRKSVRRCCKNFCLFLGFLSKNKKNSVTKIITVLFG